MIDPTDLIIGDSKKIPGGSDAAFWSLLLDDDEFDDGDGSDDAGDDYGFHTAPPRAVKAGTDEAAPRRPAGSSVDPVTDD